MKSVIFYILKQNSQYSNIEIIEKLVCNLTSKYWRSGNNILLACDSKIQALKLDELLWYYPHNSFLPHNILGEGPSCGSPIEIVWLKKLYQTKHNLLINLMLNHSYLINNFKLIIDFVPNEKKLKQLARNRYKNYRKAGFCLTTKIF